MRNGCKLHLVILPWEIYIKYIGNSHYLFDYKNKQCSVKIIMIENKTCLNFIHHINRYRDRTMQH